MTLEAANIIIAITCHRPYKINCRPQVDVAVWRRVTVECGGWHLMLIDPRRYLRTLGDERCVTECDAVAVGGLAAAPECSLVNQQRIKHSAACKRCVLRRRYTLPGKLRQRVRPPSLPTGPTTAQGNVAPSSTDRGAGIFTTASPSSTTYSA